MDSAIDSDEPTQPVGVVAGIGLAAVMSRRAASLLYGLEPYDPLSFVLAVAGLGTVSLVAAWVVRWASIPRPAAPL